MTISTDWGRDALCATTDPGVFDPGPGESSAEAKAICRLCTVTELCLEAAMREERNADQFHRATVRGGLSPRQRSALARRRKEAAKAAESAVGQAAG